MCSLVSYSIFKYMTNDHIFTMLPGTSKKGGGKKKNRRRTEKNNKEVVFDPVAHVNGHVGV